jgi:hypothetical protein
MNPLISQFANIIRHHLPEVVFGITTVTLVLAGPYLNSIVKKITGKMHWLLRFVIFVIVVCAGYGFLAHLLYITAKSWFIHMNNITLVIVSLTSYLVLAWIAKQQKEI